MSEDSSSVDFDPDAIQSIRYFRSFEFITENPKWLTNVLLLTLCQLIPIVGPLVILGYQFELAQSLLYQTDADGYANFDFDNFGKYLMRGLWPFLVAFALTAILLVPIFGLIIGVIVMAGLANDAPGEAQAALFGGAILLGIGLMIAANLYMLPMMLRAGYSQNFLQAFDLQFANDFISRMWFEMIMEAIFLAIFGSIVIFCGFLFCFIGVYFAASIITMAYAHLAYYQLYSVYLSRGGELIPLKDE